MTEMDQGMARGIRPSTGSGRIVPFGPPGLPGPDAAETDDDGIGLDAMIRNLRKTIGISRIAIFLDPAESPGHPDSSRYGRLPCAGSIGIPLEAGKLPELSRQTGIGKWIVRNCQILRREDAQHLMSGSESFEVQKEFEITHCHLAVPVTDGETTIGVALLGQPLTPGRLSDDDLRSIFHLMEELGVFVQDARRRKQLVLDNRLMTRILSAMQCGMLVAARDMTVLKANAAIKGFFGLDPDARLTFDEIPDALAASIQGAFEQMDATASFFISLPADSKKRVFRVTLQPFDENAAARSGRLIVIMEDFSEVEAAKEAAFDTAVSRLTLQLEFLENRAETHKKTLRFD